MRSDGLPTHAAARELVAGPAGAIELWLDAPAQAPRGIALIAHPQPLLGGSAQHKIPVLLSKAARDLGWFSIRPNFRGVGESAGTHTGGAGEAAELAQRGGAARHVWLAGMPAGVVVDGRSYQPAALPRGSVVVHGEHDARVPLAALLRWAEAHAQPVQVIAGADHFFRGKLPLLRDTLIAELAR
jgi:alpha/beta superfamily hydrolase